MTTICSSTFWTSSIQFPRNRNKLYTYLYSYTSLQNHLVTHPCGRFQNLNICINKNVYAYIYIFLYICVRMCLCVSHGNWMLTYTHDLFHLLNSLDDTLIDRNESLTFWKWKFFPHLSFLFNQHHMLPLMLFSTRHLCTSPHNHQQEWYCSFLYCNIFLEPLFVLMNNLYRVRWCNKTRKFSKRIFQTEKEDVKIEV